MSIWEKLPFVRTSNEAHQYTTYQGDIEGFDKTDLTRLMTVLVDRGEYKDSSVNSRIWDGTQGLEVTPEDIPPYKVKLFEQGEVTVEIPQDHPDFDMVIETLNDFFNTELKKLSS